MKDSVYKSYDELPLFLNAKQWQGCWGSHRLAVMS